jgi:hypothetical protein
MRISGSSFASKERIRSFFERVRAVFCHPPFVLRPAEQNENTCRRDWNRQVAIPLTFTRIIVKHGTLNAAIMLDFPTKQSQSRRTIVVVSLSVGCCKLGHKRQRGVVETGKTQTQDEFFLTNEQTVMIKYGYT